MSMQMIGTMLLGFVYCALGTGGSVNWPEDATASAGRSVRELREDSESLIKKSKGVTDPPQFTATIFDLCYLHREIVAHEKFGTSPQLDSVRARIAIRLKAIAKALKRDLLDQTSAVGSDRKLKPDTNDVLIRDRNTGDSACYATNRQAAGSREINQKSLEQAYFCDFITGGPAQYLAYLPGSFAPPWDHGQDLINLIETTIQPDFWVRNGGNGVIHYYQPLRILVVSGSAQVHFELTDLLGRMRALSR